MKKNTTKNYLNIAHKGFTLIELIVYVALVSIVLVGAISFAWNMIFLGEKSMAQKITVQNSQLIISEIKNVLTSATNVQIVSAQTLSATEQNGDVITISLNGNQLEKTINADSPIIISSNQVEINSLEFINSSGNNQSKNITTKLKLINTSASPKFQAELDTTQTTELKTSFNQTRSTLVDLSQATLSSNQFNLENILLQNLGSTPNTISEIRISWDNANNITAILGNSINLWSGSLTSGSLINIADQAINAGSTIPFNFNFSNSMSGSTINFDFIFNDNSLSQAQLTITAVLEPTPTPTPVPPTPTPTPPPDSCNQVCLYSSYTAGTCRANNAACNTNGETRVSAGNVFCTGGPSADTCCCKP